MGRGRASSGFELNSIDGAKEVSDAQVSEATLPRQEGDARVHLDRADGGGRHHRLASLHVVLLVSFLRSPGAVDQGDQPGRHRRQGLVRRQSGQLERGHGPWGDSAFSDQPGRFQQYVDPFGHSRAGEASRRRASKGRSIRPQYRVSGQRSGPPYPAGPLPNQLMIRSRNANGLFDPPYSWRTLFPSTNPVPDVVWVNCDWVQLPF